MNLLVVNITSSPLYSWSGFNPAYPFLQVWVTLHLLFWNSATFPPPDPGICINISNTKLAKTISSKVFTRLADQASRNMELKYFVNAECLGLESLDGICRYQVINQMFQGLLYAVCASIYWRGLPTRYLFRSKSSKVVQLALVRLTWSMPEDKPLHHLGLFLGIGEAEVMVFIHHVDKIE